MSTSNTINLLITMILTFWFFFAANKRKLPYFWISRISKKSYHLIGLPISSSLIKFHDQKEWNEISALFTTNCIHITVSLWTDRTRKRKLSYSIARRYYTVLRTALFPQWDAFKQIFKSGRGSRCESIRKSGQQLEIGLWNINSILICIRLK